MVSRSSRDPIEFQTHQLRRAEAYGGTFVTPMQLGPLLPEPGSWVHLVCSLARRPEPEPGVFKGLSDVIEEVERYRSVQGAPSGSVGRVQGRRADCARRRPIRVVGGRRVRGRQ